MGNIRKIVFITNSNITDMFSWSITSRTLPLCLEKQGYKIEIIDDLFTKNSFFDKVNNKISKHIYKKNFQFERQPYVIRNYAKQINERLKKIDCDLIFSLGTLPVAFLDTKKPIVFWTDANFAGMINYYPGFDNLSSRTIKNGNFVEQSALDKCKLAIYSSEWAAETAIKYYNVDSSKIKVVMQGANLDSERSELEIEKIIERKSFDKCKLLFAGLEWERKGGDIALKITENLNKQGINTELNVLGCKPEFTSAVPDSVKIFGFVSKSTQEGRNLIEKLYEEAHFFVMPSRAEAYGMVYAIANSYGIPSIGTKTGGITSVIKDDVNGKTFELDSEISEYSNYLKSVFTNQDLYRKFCMDSYMEFNKRLNWDKAGESIKKLLDEI